MPKNSIVKSSKTDNLLSSTHVRSRMKELTAQVNQSNAEMAMCLEQILTRDLHKEWGYETFEQYVQAETHLQARQAYNYVSTLRRARMAGISEKTLKELPWGGLRVAANSLSEDDPEKNKELIEKIKTMPTMELQRALDKAKGGEEWHTVHVRLSDDQFKSYKEAIERAEKATGSNKEGWLLDVICMDYKANEYENRGQALDAWIQRFENNYGVTVVILDKQDPNYAQSLREMADTFESAKK